MLTSWWVTVRFFPGKNPTNQQLRCVNQLRSGTRGRGCFLPISVPATALETGFVNRLGLKEKK